MKKPYPVKVEWEDANAFGGWKPLDEYRKNGSARCVTVGFVIERTNKKMVILQSISDQGNGTDGIVIPSKSIKRVRRLREH